MSMDAKEIKKELCRVFDLRRTQLSVREARVTLAWEYKFELQTKDEVTDAKAQDIYDYLRQHKDRFGLTERVDYGSDADYGPPYPIRLDVSLHLSRGFVPPITYPEHVSPAPPPPEPLPVWVAELARSEEWVGDLVATGLLTPQQVVRFLCNFGYGPDAVPPLDPGPDDRRRVFTETDAALIWDRLRRLRPEARPNALRVIPDYRAMFVGLHCYGARRLGEDDATEDEFHLAYCVEEEMLDRGFLMLADPDPTASPSAEAVDWIRFGF